MNVPPPHARRDRGRVILLRFAILIIVVSVMQTFVVVDGRKSKKRTGSFPTIASKALALFWPTFSGSLIHSDRPITC